jgi:hypothetical protein
MKGYPNPTFDYLVLNEGRILWPLDQERSFDYAEARNQARAHADERGRFVVLCRRKTQASFEAGVAPFVTFEHTKILPTSCIVNQGAKYRAMKGKAER